MAERTITDLYDLIASGRGGVGSSGNSAGRRSDVNSGLSTDEINRQLKAAQDNFRAMNTYLRLTPSAQKKQTDAVYQNKRAIEDLERSFEEATRSNDAQVKAAAPLLKKALDEAKARDAGSESLKTFGEKADIASNLFSKSSGLLLNAGLKLAGDMQSGASGFQIASTMLNAGADIAGAGIQAAGAGLQSVGSVAMANGKGLAKGFGGLAVVVGSLTSAFSGLAVTAFKGVNGVLMTEADKLTKSFETATSSGALLSGGAQEMTDSLKGTPYVLEDYANAVKRNSGLLSDTNMGVGEASKMFGNVSRSMGTFRNGLYAAGIGYETQLDIIAKSAANIRASMPNPMQKITNEQVLQVSKEYAKNLAVMSAITGESADALMKKKALDADTAGFELMIRDLGAAGPGVRAALDQMDPAFGRLVYQLAKFGVPIDEATQALAVMSPAIYETAQQASGQLKAGTLSLETIQSLAKARQGAITAELNDRNSFARSADAAGGALATGAATAVRVGKVFEKMAGAADEALAATEANIEKGSKVDPKKASDDLTESLIGVKVAGQDLKVAFQQLIIDNALPTYNNLVKQAITELQGIMSEAKKVPGIWDQAKAAASDPTNWLMLAAGVQTAVSAFQGFKAVKGWFGGGGGKPPDLPMGGTGPGGGKPPGTGGMPTGSTLTEAEQAAEKARLLARAKELKSTGNAATSAEALAAARAEAAAAEKAAARAAEEAAAKATAKAAAEAGLEAGAKVGAKSVLRQIPLLGLGMGLVFAAQRAYAGDYAKAGAELVAGAASTLPGWGTAASIGITAGLATSDIYDAVQGAKGATATPTPATPPTAGPNGEPLMTNSRGQVGYMSRNGRSASFVAIPGATMPSATPTTPPAAPATPTAPAAPAGPPPGPQGSLESPEGMRTLASAIQLGTYNGMQQAMPLLGAAIQQNGQFVQNAAISQAMTAAQQIAEQVNAGNLTPESAKLIAQLSDPTVSALNNLLAAQREQLAALKKTVDQNESLLAYYKDNQNKQAQIVSAVEESNVQLRRIYSINT